MNPRLLLPVLLVLSACGGSTGSSATPEVRVRATDALRFEPGEITATPGERVSFVVTNDGTVDHEFVLGTAEFMAGHAAAAEGGGDHSNHGAGTDGIGLDLPAGRTGRVTFRLPEGPLTFACFVDRHDKAGMTGTVRSG